MEYTGYTTRPITIDDFETDLEVDINGTSTYMSVNIGEIEIESGTEVEIEVDTDELFSSLDTEELRELINNNIPSLTDLVSYEEMTGMVVDHALAMGTTEIMRLIGQLVKGYEELEAEKQARIEQEREAALLQRDREEAAAAEVVTAITPETGSIG